MSEQKVMVMGGGDARSLSEVAQEILATLNFFKQRAGAYLVDSGETSTTWYRKYSDGWVEQGGNSSANHSNRATVTYPVSFSNNNFSLCVSNKTNTHGEGYYWNVFTVLSNTKSSFVVSNWGGTDKFSWFACGYS